MAGNLTESQSNLLEVVDGASGVPLPDLLGRRRWLDPLVSRETHAADYDALCNLGLIRQDGWQIVLTHSGRMALRESRDRRMAAMRGCANGRAS